MAWTTPRTWVVNEVLTAALLNTHVRDNLLELAPDVAWWKVVQGFIEGGNYRLAAQLGAAHAGTYATGDEVGLGFEAVIQGATGAISGTVSGQEGRWNFSTGTTNPTDVGVRGPAVLASHDWTFIFRGVLESEAGASILIGGIPQGTSFADANNLIAWRVAGTGTIVGVCDNAATETTRDTSVTPNGSTVHTLRIEVRSGGTIVRFYRNNVQVGADVTTNINTAAMMLAAGVRGVGTDHDMYVEDVSAWRENP